MRAISVFSHRAVPRAELALAKFVPGDSMPGVMGGGEDAVDIDAAHALFL